MSKYINITINYKDMHFGTSSRTIRSLIIVGIMNNTNNKTFIFKKRLSERASY